MIRTFPLTCLFTIAILNSSCSDSSNKGQHSDTFFDKQGHRGARGNRPENSISAMYFALDAGVTTLEMDVVISADGKVVLSHDPFFSHLITTTPEGLEIKEEEEKSYNLYRMTYEEIKKFDIGLKPHPLFQEQLKLLAYKPLLSEVIDSAEAYARNRKRPLPFYNIETKTSIQGDNVFHPEPEKFVNFLMDQITLKKIESRTIIQSFDFRTLKLVKKKHPHMRVAALIEDYDKRPASELIASLGFVPEIYSPHHSLVTAELVNYCHVKGMKLIPWTVNDPALMKQLKALGVDGIISDYPELFNID